MPKKQKWKTFFFDGRGWYDVVDTPEKFKDLLSIYKDLKQLLSVQRLSEEEEKKLFGSLPRFGNRREYTSWGTQTLGEWLVENKINLAFVKRQKTKK
jgi:hypothetical protein